MGEYERSYLIFRATVQNSFLRESGVQHVAGMSQSLDEMAVGQNAVAAIVGAVVFVFVVLLITDILCFTDVFPFVHCAGE